MLNLQNPHRLMSSVCLLLGLAMLAGCHQLSKTARAERVIEEEDMPHRATLGPSYGTESPELQPVPPQPYPSIPLLPPPAPPSDAARRDKLAPEASEDVEWDDEAFADTDDNVEEFFPSSAANVSRELLAERAAETESRLAEAGHLASLRRAAHGDQLPVIVPGTPKLRPVSEKHLILIPVPR